MDKNELREKIKACLLGHLTSLGYPNLTREQILAQLKPMWISLEENNLIQQGWSYQLFCQIAMTKAQEAEIFDYLRKS